MSESPVFMFDNDDPQMQEAYKNARSTFRYFWREVAWERRRIVPGLDLAAVKAPFSDGNKVPRAKDTPEVEHMWMSEIDFDGKVVSGVLLNSPNWLKTVKEGDSARIPLDQISDWMYAIQNEVYGAYTVNLMRSRMGRAERTEHDNAWGLNFGDTTKIRVAYQDKKAGGFLKGLFGGKQDAAPIPEEHPMSENMAPSLKDALAKDPSMVKSADEKGWTYLHQLALAGSTAGVRIMLDAGADPNAKTAHGMTPLQLAKSLGWDKVAALLVSKGAK
jgi:uncharacterized protein YegJ (DUF2314 family)